MTEKEKRVLKEYLRCNPCEVECVWGYRDKRNCSEKDCEFLRISRKIREKIDGD